MYNTHHRKVCDHFLAIVYISYIFSPKQKTTINPPKKIKHVYHETLIPSH